ncbi:hypothetical protein AB0H36_39815 [Kribbella sp. NPDC050820]|uniref:hypothetical protein n=1 Tax=Kribbella sp. NPDC050820 TaxID=3155408 RepID=UPI0033C0DC0A
MGRVASRPPTDHDHPRADFVEGAKGVQLAELGLQSWREGRKLEVPPLDLEGKL